MTHRLSYSLELSTGESLDVLEIELDGTDELDGEIARLCTTMPREVLEEAKVGHTSPFEKLLRTPPVGALLRLNGLCDQIDDCPLANRSKCVTSNVRGKTRFPSCWDHGVGTLNTEVVHAWRDGAYVIVVQSV